MLLSLQLTSPRYPDYVFRFNTRPGPGGWKGKGLRHRVAGLEVLPVVGWYKGPGMAEANPLDLLVAVREIIMNDAGKWHPYMNELSSALGPPEENDVTNLRLHYTNDGRLYEYRLRSRDWGAAGEELITWSADAPQGYALFRWSASADGRTELYLHESLPDHESLRQRLHERLRENVSRNMRTGRSLLGVLATEFNCAVLYPAYEWWSERIVLLDETATVASLEMMTHRFGRFRKRTRWFLRRLAHAADDVRPHEIPFAEYMAGKVLRGNQIWLNQEVMGEPRWLLRDNFAYLRTRGTDITAVTPAYVGPVEGRAATGGGEEAEFSKLTDLLATNANDEHRATEPPPPEEETEDPDDADPEAAFDDLDIDELDFSDLDLDDFDFDFDFDPDGSYDVVAQPGQTTRPVSLPAFTEPLFRLFPVLYRLRKEPVVVVITNPNQRFHDELFHQTIDVLLKSRLRGQLLFDFNYHPGLTRTLARRGEIWFAPEGEKCAVAHRLPVTIKRGSKVAFRNAVRMLFRAED